MPNRRQPASRPTPETHEELLARVVKRVSKEMPDVAGTLGNIKPYTQGNLLDRMMYPKGAYAITLPGGRMLYDPETMNDEQTMLDTLTHEGAHLRDQEGESVLDQIGQIIQSLYTPYEKRPWEKNARQSEQWAHESRLGRDIHLK